MPLTKAFKDTVRERAQKDKKFRTALLQEAIDEFLNGDYGTAKILLRNYVKAAMTFEELAEEVNLNNKSIQRMLSSSGNPTSENLFAMIHAIQRIEGITFETKIH